MGPARRGVGLLLSALVLFAAQSGQAGVAREVLVAGALGVAGLALTVGPWLFRLAGDLSEERAERVRSQERADVAAHLHDSVLQTLALIQKHADDGRTVTRIARAQERDLRTWLYGDVDAADTSVAGALRRPPPRSRTRTAFGRGGHRRRRTPRGAGAAARARRARGDGERRAALRAAQVDVYAEAGPTTLEVFVRDRGVGFDRGRSPATASGCATASRTGCSDTAGTPTYARRRARAPRCTCR